MSRGVCANNTPVDTGRSSASGYHSGGVLMELHICRSSETSLSSSAKEERCVNALCPHLLPVMTTM